MDLMDLMDLMYFFGDPNPSEIHGVWNLFIQILKKSMDYGFDGFHIQISIIHNPSGPSDYSYVFGNNFTIDEVE